jgi:drug/metabolite transporter (DMT)-like permease
VSLFIAYVSIFFAVVSWGLEYVVVEWVEVALSPVAIGTVIFSTAALLLAFVLGIRRLLGYPLRRPGDHQKRVVVFLLVIGLISSLCNILWIFGQRLTTPANVSALARTDILFTILFSLTLFKEPIPKTSLIFVPLMLAGIYLTTGIDIARLHFGNPGDYMVILSALLLSINAYIIKHTIRGISEILVAFCNTATNAITFIVIGWISGLWNTPLFQQAPPSIWAVTALGGCCTFIFFVGYYSALNRLPVFEVRLLCLLVPVVTILVSWKYLNLLPTALQGLGIALILIGAAFLILSTRRKTQKQVED